MKKVLKGTKSRYVPLVQALIISNLVSFLLFFVRVAGAENFRFWFLFWNLLLAGVPLIFATLLVHNLGRKRWLSMQNLILTLLWLAFLPNSFYILTDFIHVHLTGEINILFDVVLFFSCVFNGFVFGYMSVYMVHRQLLKRIMREKAHAIMGVILFACSFAVYLGRYLRWNSWDVLVHPFSILFDITGRLIDPISHPQTASTTLSFFLLLTSVYIVIYEFIQLLRGQQD